MLTINNFKKTTIFILFFISLTFAGNVLAANVNLKTNSLNVSVGDTVAAEVVIDTEGQSVNVIDGGIKIVNADIIDIKDLNIANSELTNWVRPPSWSSIDNSISFVGGTPGGFNNSNASLFKIFFTVKKSGQIIFTPNQIKAYANDGVATPVAVSVKDLTIVVNNSTSLAIKNEWKESLNKDTKAPLDIKADFGQDESLFDGKKFILISAIDNDSGLDYFEVKEGDRAVVKTSGSYVLQNQIENEPITIFAFDKAGNISRRLLNEQPVKISRGYTAVILMIVLLVVGLVIFKIIKIKIKK